MRVFATVILILATSAGASELKSEQKLVLDCLSGMETDTSWNQCLNMLFEPCASLTVGFRGSSVLSWGAKAELAASHDGAPGVTE